MPLTGDGRYVRPLLNGCLACGVRISLEAFYCSAECASYDASVNLPHPTLTREQWLTSVDNN